MKKIVSDEHILMSYGLDGNGAGITLSMEAISQRLKNKDLTWIHLDGNSAETRYWLETEHHELDSFIIDALLDEETRPRMIQVDDGMLLILRGVNLNQNADPEDMVSIRMWIDGNTIVTVRRRNLKAISDVEKLLKVGKGPKSSNEFLTLLISKISDRIEPILATLNDLIDDIESKILDNPDDSFRESVISIRKDAIIYRRYMAPQKEAIDQIRMSKLTWLDEDTKNNLYEAHNHLVRYVEDLDAIRERAQVIKDELANILADKINRNMYVLSVIAAIFLPLGFLTGLFGINLGGIPGADSGWAFWIFCGIMTTVVGIQIAVFKKLKWF